MKKLLLILLCVPLLFSCGEKENDTENTEKNDINELKENNNKYEYFPENIHSTGYITYGKIFNKETGELWSVDGRRGNVSIQKIVSEEDIENSDFNSPVTKERK